MRRPTTIAASLLALLAATAGGGEASGPIVILKSSIFAAAVDNGAIAKATGRQVTDRTDLGSQSLMKLAMFCRAAAGSPKPAMVVVEERHNYALIPNLRAGGKYRGRIDKEIGDDAELKAIAERKCFSLPFLTYGGGGPVDLGTWDFQAGVEASLLPDFVRRARAAGVLLVFARFRAHWNATNKPTPQMLKYRDDFAAWLQRHGAHLLDYTECPELTPDMYGNGSKPDDHMNGRGRAAFSPLIAEDLAALVAGRKPPRGRTDPQALGKDLPGDAPGKATASAPASPAPERVAAAHLDQLRILQGRLHAVPNSPARYDAPAYFARNRAILVQMADLAARIASDFPAAPAAAEAKALATRYALPARPKEAGNEIMTVEATVEAVSSVVSDPRKILPYVDALMMVRYRVDRVIDGTYARPALGVFHWAILEGARTPTADLKPGARFRLKVDLFDAHKELSVITVFSDAEDPDLPPYWVLEATPLPATTAGPGG